MNYLYCLYLNKLFIFRPEYVYITNCESEDDLKYGEICSSV
jgi:hypothetical protein